MRDMFQSATLKLTVWYLLIIMTVSIAFSVAIYRFTLGEFSARLDVVQAEIESEPRFNLPANFLWQVRSDQYEVASQSFLAGLFYVNLIILVGGGFCSYALARRTLRPIEEANETQSRFVADASHQLRTPLAIMKAELETAQRSDHLTKKETDELLSSTIEEVDRLTSLSHRLLELSRLDNHTTPPKLEAIELDKLVKQAVKRHNKSHKRLRLTAKSGVKIKANKHSIEELIDILIDNALKFSPHDTKVTLNLETKANRVLFSVSNQGDGIPENELSKVFDRFYRSQTSRSANGYGLGLAIAKKIVDSHGGDLFVESKSSGPTTFTARLPLEDSK